MHWKPSLSPSNGPQTSWEQFVGLPQVAMNSAEYKAISLTLVGKLQLKLCLLGHDLGEFVRDGIVLPYRNSVCHSRLLC